MSLKENVKAIKEELSTEEQFLESVIKAEGFWKKYKTPLILLSTAVVVGFLAKAVMGYLHESNIEASNEAYSALLKDSADTSALATLKSKNPKLYEMFLFKDSMKNQDPAVLAKSASAIQDPVLKKLLQYQVASLNKKVTASDAGIATEFALLQEGYLLLKENKIKEARAKLAKIPKNSALSSVVASLNHYMGK